MVACLGCVALVAWRGNWEGHLTRENHTWVVHLAPSPVWAPPPDPPNELFEGSFKESKELPPNGTRGVTIRRVLRLDWMAVDLLFDLWIVTVTGGLFFLAV